MSVVEVLSLEDGGPSAHTCLTSEERNTNNGV